MQVVPMTAGSVCSGIGGIDLGLSWAGFQIKWQAEINEHCNGKNEEHWPEAIQFGDVCSIDAKELPFVDLLCGGYPCQPFSKLGKRRGKSDDRHLWPELIRIIRDLRKLGKSPSWCLFENVAGHVSMGLDCVLADLEGAGYACWPLIIPACAVGARQQRDRVWILASSHGQLLEGGKGHPTERESQSLKEFVEGFQFPDSWPSLPIARSYRAGNGLPEGVEQITALGNAVFPKLVTVIGRAIMLAESCSRKNTTGAAS